MSLSDYFVQLVTEADLPAERVVAARNAVTRYMRDIVMGYAEPKYTCAACGMTEDHHRNEVGMGHLIPVEIQIDTGEELQCYTGELDPANSNPGYPEFTPGPARLCNEHFVEWLDAQPAWLQAHFAQVNPAHYDAS